MTHPFRKQPPKAFWMRSIAPHYPLDIPDWYEPKFPIGDKKIATAGSCFAQHIGRNLRQRGFKYIDTEQPPGNLDESLHLDYGYGMYSARYGNIYTARQLHQLARRALKRWQPAETAWKYGDGVVDPFRPTIEKEPFSSVSELRASQVYHLECVAEIFRQCDVFIFTLGLTETWESLQDGAVFPLCPGTRGGSFSADAYAFKNLTAEETLADMINFIQLAREVNPKLHFLLTVSPVPLMATATNNNVAVATMYSKSVLRSVAGQLTDEFDYIDYFPSYEIISSTVMRGQFYNPDGREVSQHGVKHVMEIFFSAHQPPLAMERPLAARAGSALEAELEEAERVLCDEEILRAFDDSAEAAS